MLTTFVISDSYFCHLRHSFEDRFKRLLTICNLSESGCYWSHYYYTMYYTTDMLILKPIKKPYYFNSYLQFQNSEKIVYGTRLLDPQRTQYWKVI